MVAIFRKDILITKEEKDITAGHGIYIKQYHQPAVCMV